MKRLIVLMICLLLAFAIIGGCSAQKEPVEKPGAAGHAEEMADTTRMDSAAMEATMEDTTVTDTM